MSKAILPYLGETSVLRYHQIGVWLMESDAVKTALQQQPELSERYDAYRRLAEGLLSKEALQMATQRAVWAVTSGVTPQRLHEDALCTAKTPEERLIAELDLQLFAPYVQMMLAEAGIQQSWELPEGGWLPPVQDKVAYPVIEALLPSIPLPRLLQAAKECVRTSRFAAATFYYEQALRQPHHPALSAYLCWQLAYCYDRLSQLDPSPSMEQKRRQAQKVLSSLSAVGEAPRPGEGAPDLAELPFDRVYERLRVARRALVRAEYFPGVEAAHQALSAGASEEDTCHALRLLAHASLVDCVRSFLT